MKLHNEYGQSWFLAAALIDGPRSLEQLKEYYHVVARRFGMFINVMNARAGGLDLEENLRSNLKDLVSQGWITHDDGLYHITDLGRDQAELMLKDLERGGRIIEKGTHPETVSKVTLIVHFVLAAVKLPAAVFSGSVGLLNDSLDTLMDGISSLFVYFGVRAGRERLVSYILLLCMSLTGLYSLYEAIRRLINPTPLESDMTTFVAVSISAALCALLWIYQKFSGLRHSCVPLIAQSIDSRNHIIIAAGVAVGLVAATFDIMLLDQLVGLSVAILILKGAAELLIDLLRSGNDKELDLSKYGFQRLDRHRHRQFVRWFLFEIQKGRITTRDEMFKEARAATDFNQIASLRALGLAEQSGREQKIESAAEEVFSRALAEEISSADFAPQDSAQPSGPSKVLRLTPAGESELHSALSDNWSLTFGRYRALLVRGLVVGIFYIITFATVRWIIGLLNNWIVPLETWTAAGPYSLPAALHSCAGSIFSFGPFSFTALQAVGFLIGLILFYCGRMISHTASHAIHHARENTRHSQKPRSLITKGPFAIRRHPMYTGHILITLGLSIALHSVYALAWSALAVIVQLSGAFYEERRLEHWFPQEYPQYRRKIKRRFLSWPQWFIIGSIYAAAWLGIFY